MSMESALTLRTLGKAPFFLHFDALVRQADPEGGLWRWNLAGAAWSRTRNSHYGPDYSLTTDVTLVSRDEKHGWKLMVVRDAWWIEDGRDPIKSREWLQLISGNRQSVLRYFNALDTPGVLDLSSKP